jgi:hypothetical protein
VAFSLEYIALVDPLGDGREFRDLLRQCIAFRSYYKVLCDSHRAKFPTSLSTLSYKTPVFPTNST